MRRILPDTNVLIDWINQGRYGELLLAKGVVKHLSSVVLLELEAGAFSPKDQRKVQRLGDNFERAGRIVTPALADYPAGGRLLRQLQAEKGYDLSKAHSLVNDVLIALSARRIGATLLTQNARNFEPIAELMPLSLALV